MATNKSTRDVMVIAAVTIAVVLTVMANLLADRKFVRIDLTNEGRYSLSPEFINIVGRLEDTLDITYYISQQVPPEFANGKRDIIDKLKEIELASRGKIKWKPIDPKDDEQLREELQTTGGTQEVEVRSKDQRNRSLLTSSLKITYQDKPKVLTPFVGQAEQLEYLIGSKIVELTLKKKPIIALDLPAPPQQPQMFGQQQPQQGSGYEWLQSGQFEELKKFEVKNVDISENNTIPSDASVLVMIRPKTLGERQRYELVKYLAGGGKVFLIQSGFKVSNEFGSWRNEKTPSGLEDYLKDLGITFGTDLVCDASNMQMPNPQSLFTQGKLEYSRYPFYVRILGENIDQESNLTRFMPGLLMPMPSEMKVDFGEAKKAGMTARVLAKTSVQSWRVPFSENIKPNNPSLFDEATQKFDGSMDVIVSLEGQFPFPYDGKPIPDWKKEDPANKDNNKDKAKEPDKDSKKGEMASMAKKPGALMLCSCPEAFHLMYLNNEALGSQMRTNIFLMVNIMETLGLGSDDLVKLRTKRYETRSIEKLAGKENDVTRERIKIALIFGVPLAIALFALARTFFRRNAQVRYERQFAQTIGPSSFNP